MADRTRPLSVGEVRGALNEPNLLPGLRNEQYYEAIMSIWNQLYINIKSLISWQYCLKDINYINSLTVSMVSSEGDEVT